MIEEAPEPKETSNYHFSQLRTLKILKGHEQAPKDSVNVVAAASKYGLLFVGISNGFKVLKLENILDLDEDKDNRSFIENYYSQSVITEPPVLLSLSADQKTLAVCLWRNSSVVADMYDIAAFADPDIAPVPFFTVQLSGSGCKLKEFAWNPVIEGMYSYCMSDGSLYIHELSGMKLTVVSILPNATATAVCWSPKGKQLVVGKLDGSFSQYKPTLQEVKNIPAPYINEKLIVSNICWISTTQFGVLYIPEGKSVSPYFFTVTTQKGAPVVYTNFYDVCVGNATSDDQRYFLHHESAWGVLTCASVDSIDVAVLGDPPSWVPWELREDGRALLPIKNKAKCWIGMDVMYSAQRRIVKSETEAYPPMPIIFFLTDNGLLVPYHMINSSPDCASLVRPATPIEREGERKRIGGNGNNSKPVAASKPVPNTSTASNIYAVSPMQSVFQPPIGNNTIPFCSEASSGFSSGASPSFSSGASVGFGNGVNTTFSSETSSAVGFVQNSVMQKNEPPLPPSHENSPSFQPFQRSSFSSVTRPEVERFHKPSKGHPPLSPTTSTSSRDLGGVRHVALAHRSTGERKVETEKDSQNSSSVPHLQIGFDGAGDGVRVNKENINDQNTYLIAIMEEIQAFEKEIQDLKNSSQHFGTIGTKDEMAKLQSFTINFQEFQHDMSETMVSLNNDIHSLKNVLLESFVMVEEANSRERRKNDHSYISMLKDRALDPMTAKRMQKIDQHYLYLNTQLQEVRNKLDQDWYEYLEKKKEQQQAVRHISSTEAIYKTIVNNQKIIHNLRKNIDYILKKASQKKLDNISNRRNRTQFTKKTGPEELSKLADEFLQAKISTYEEEKPQTSKKMSPQAQNMLKKYLSSSSITTVRPTVVYSPSQSRLISRTLLYSDKIAEKKFSTPLHENTQSISNYPTLEKGLTISRPNAIIPPTNAASPPVRIPRNNEAKIIPINKPQVTSGLVFDKLKPTEIVPLKANQPNVPEPKSSFNIPAPSFSDPLTFAEDDDEPDLSPASSIASPSYEDITPPDSPTIRNHPVSFADDTKILQVSLSRGVPEVQSCNLSAGIEKNVTTTSFERPHVSQYGKNQVFGNTLQTSATSSSNESTTLSFGFPSLGTSFGVTKPSASGVLSDSSLNLKPNQTIVVKPSVSTFSFLPTSSAASAFSFSSKNDENKPIGTSQSFAIPSQDSKFTFNLASKSDSSTSTLQSSENKAGSSVSSTTASGLTKFGISNILNSGVSSTVASKPSVMPLQPVATSSSLFSSLGGQSSSIFGSKDATQSKPVSFFSQTLASKTSASQPVSTTDSTENPSGLIITSVQSVTPQEHVATVSTTSTSDSNPISTSSASAFSFKINTSSLSSIPVSNNQSTLSQSPVNLTQANVSVSTSDSPLNLAGTTSASTTTSASKTVSLESIIASALDKKTELSESDQANQQTFKSLFNPEASASPIAFSSTPSQQQTSAATSTSDLTTKSIFGQPAISATLSTSSVATTATISSGFGNTLSSTTSNTVFGQSPSTTSPSTVFGQTPISTAPNTVFGSAPNTTAPNTVFGCAPNTTAPNAVFGSDPTTTTANTIFGQASSAASSTTAFGQASVSASSPAALTTTTGSVFGQASGTTPSFFGQAATTTQPSLFGQATTTQSTSIFGQPTTTQTSFFNKPVTTEASSTQNPVFGSSATTTAGPFTQAAGSFFSQPLGGQTSVFGGNTASTGGNTGFGDQTSSASGFSFGKSTFGQETQGTFGLAKTVFGQNAQAPAFGQPASPSSGFGQSAGNGLFGQGSFFNGLGGKPSAENANKNVFGGVGNLAISSSESTSVFGGASSFGAKPGGAFGSGSFTAGAGSVAQSGFGAFQQQTTPQKTGGFGSAPAFGSAAAFGSAPAFGSPPSFGSGGALGSVFGSQPSGQTANFSNFASANAPTFGSLASQSPPAFGSPQQPQQPAFGQQPASPFAAAPVFGSSPSFGGTPGFGGASSLGNASAFTQWRN